MANSLSDRFRHWFDYERDAHAKVLASLETVPEERRSDPDFRRALTIFGHVMAARRAWLGRLGTAPLFKGQLFPAEVELSQLKDDCREVEALWTEAYALLDDSALDRVVEYQSFDGNRFRNSVEEILTQLFGHSWYHRGQIAMLVRASGGQPAMTDLIYWCREPLT
ncbi:MAG: DinB family protein [Paludisphaera borealis]|nr:DinB family protein [Paludisphaera borealis]